MHPRVLIVKSLRALKLNRIAARVYYKYFHGFSSAGKELPSVIEKCFNKAIDMGTTNLGDYYEFGVFKGHTFAHACKYGEAKNLSKMNFFGFDSFKGLPEIEGIDKTDQEIFYEGQYEAPKDQVLNDLTKAGVNLSHVNLIEGFFNESLNDVTREKFKMNKIAIALIDCDLYSSTVDVLNFIKPMLIKNSIMIFDDYNSFAAYESKNELGQKKAFKDFQNENKNFNSENWFNYGAYGSVFIVNSVD